MSQSIQVLHLPTPVMPRGAVIGAALYQSAARMVYRLLQRRAAVPRRIREAAYVRRLAAEMERSDPGMAADLYAAACRHEQGE
jgi:hypothetical protein